MLELRDRMTLPPGVRLVPGALVDEVRGLELPLNPAGEVVLRHAAEGLDIGVSEIVSRWGIDHVTARHDVLRFVWELNGHGLLNRMAPPGHARRARSWLGVAVRTMPFGRLPQPAVTRRALDTRSPTRALVSTCRALARPVGALTLLATVVFFLVGLVGGTADPGPPAALGVALGGALALHEAAHAVALRGVPSAVVLLRSRVSLLHPALHGRRAMTVALAGPAAPLGVGLGLAVLALRTGSPVAGAAACPPAAHGVAATVVGRDGRIACGVVVERPGVAARRVA